MREGEGGGVRNRRSKVSGIVMRGERSDVSRGRREGEDRREGRRVEEGNAIMHQAERSTRGR